VKEDGVLSRSVSDLWYKDAIIYCIDVETYMDGNGDGIGDFRGLTVRLNHLAGLGVTCLWLLPFYPSPNRDNGYDIADYYGVDPRYGSLGDFVEFLRQARQRGMKVIVDLVVNHTSDQHPWFQAARADRDSPFRSFYIWEDEPPAHQEPNVFPGKETGTWQYDEHAGQYYYHRFYHFEPDLNMANTAVRDELRKVIGFWMELGISGFRVDAVPFLIESVEGSIVVDPASFLWEMCRFVNVRSGDAILLGEANVPPSQPGQYFDQGNGMQMLFNFIAMNYTFGALVRQAATLLADALNIIPAIHPIGQWTNFLRNHDELDLSRLPQSVQDDHFAACAPDQSMRLYNRGIRRRLAPMLGGDQRRLELAYSLMFTLPGTPVLWYGDEIGMGEDLAQEERLSVRTPMQWTDDPNAGFSSADPEKLVRPVISGGKFGYERVNVIAQQRVPESLMNWVERAIRNHKEHPAFGRGAVQVLGTVDRAVFGHRLDWDSDHMLLVHNLASRPRTATVPVPTAGMRQLFGNRSYALRGRKELTLELDGHGYAWIELRE